MASAREDVTWDTYHLEVAFDWGLGRWEGFRWWDRWSCVQGTAQRLGGAETRASGAAAGPTCPRPCLGLPTGAASPTTAAIPS